MTSELTQSPPRKGNALHFRKTLENIVRVRPRYPIDTWTDADAAAFWVDDYDYDKANPLSPGLIVAVAHRLVAVALYNHRKFHRFIQQYRSDMVWQPTWNRILGSMFKASRDESAPPSASMPTFSPSSADGTYALRPMKVSFCHKSSCRKTDSFLGGCLTVQAFNRLEYSGQLVSWSSVNWSGFGCWFTPIRFAVDDPYVSVQRPRSHFTEKLVTRDVAMMLRDFHDLMPYLMLTLRSNEYFGNALRVHLETLEGERLRYYGMVVHDPDCTTLMNNWDATFARHCWLFGGSDKVYGNYDERFWGLDWDKFSQICVNQLDGLFPVLPEPSTT